MVMWLKSNAETPDNIIGNQIDTILIKQRSGIELRLQKYADADIASDHNGVVTVFHGKPKKITDEKMFCSNTSHRRKHLIILLKTLTWQVKE